ncbi:MAG TPA: S1C family serine protease [Caldimonas sp.]|jgi:S1-C subfamily serine protease|nr:S1C family serine protease [Caldimonas sp.]
MNPAPSSRSFPGLDRHPGFRWRRCSALLVGAAMLIAGAASAAEPTSEPTLQVRATLARLEAHKEALARANAAVLGLEVTAVDDARSIATLGKERQGSGVLIGDDGLVLTIGYLILEADQVDLVAVDGRHVPARVVAYDQASGFGLVQALAPLGIAPVPLGVSAAVATDEPLLFASGGDDRDLTVARMVSRRPFSGYWEYHIDDAMFTAPVRTDHSGAGLFNADGELVGVGSLVVGNAAGSNGPALRGNMFVPVDLLKPILAEMRAQGSSRGSSRAWLGLNCVEVGGQVHVVRLSPESPAEAAGLLPQDIIVAVDGVGVADLASMYHALWRGDRPDRDVLLEIRRNDETIRLSVHAIDRMSTLSRPRGV